MCFFKDKEIFVIEGICMFIGVGFINNVYLLLVFRRSFRILFFVGRFDFEVGEVFNGMCLNVG